LDLLELLYPAAKNNFDLHEFLLKDLLTTRPSQNNQDEIAGRSRGRSGRQHSGI
jgi:hypothetical protein